MLDRYVEIPRGLNLQMLRDKFGEDATPDDAGSDCMANWNYFRRHYTCIEAERAIQEMEGKKNGKT